MIITVRGTSTVSILTADTSPPWLLHIHVHVDQGGLVSYLISNLQVVVKVLHIHVHVDQGGLVHL
jgi:hypothetical protein